MTNHCWRKLPCPPKFPQASRPHAGRGAPGGVGGGGRAVGVGGNGADPGERRVAGTALLDYHPVAQPLERSARLGADAVVHEQLVALAVDARLVDRDPDTLTILSESSDYAVQAIGWVGRVSPAYCTSVGQALLLDHDRPSLDRLFRDTEFRQLGPNTSRNVKELARRIDVARDRGYAIADEELELGLVSAAVPVRDGTGRIVAALNVSAPKFRFGDRVDEAGAALVVAARQLGATLSGSPGRAAS